MPTTYKGEPVTLLRAATFEDPGFMGPVDDQMLIRLSDGTETIVSKGDLKDTEAEAEACEDTGPSVLGFQLPSARKAKASPRRKK